MEDNWVKIYSAPELVKVELAKHLLDENNIDNYIMDKADSALVVLGEIELYTPEEQAEKAVSLLREGDFGHI